MNKVKFIYPILTAAILFSFVGCDWEDDDVDYLVGSAWVLDKTTTYAPSGRVRGVFYDDDVTMKFYHDGDVSIRTTTVGRFGRVYEDWYMGSWRLFGDELTLHLESGVYEYVVEHLSNWHLVLRYYQDVYDDFGELIYTERVEEEYVR